jgi:ABC-type antimicrobial peptide transport system permease subunit
LLGVAGAWSLAGFLESFLFEVQPHDPAVYFGVFVVLTLTGLAAALLPARRAARVDPLVALRAD